MKKLICAAALFVTPALAFQDNIARGLAARTRSSLGIVSGITADAQYSSAMTVSVGTGLNNYTITGATFGPADIGKLITVGMAGGGGASIRGTITGVAGSVVTISTAALTTLSAQSTYVIWGTDARAALQSAVTAQDTVRVPRGRYLISDVVLLHSRSAIRCDPGAEFVFWNAQQSRTNHWIFTNVNFTASVLTDANMSVDGCAFEGVATNPSTGAQAVRFRLASDVSVTNSEFRNLGNGTSMLATLRSFVAFNRAYNIANTCWDHWEAWAEARTESNYCETLKHGVQATGTDTAQTGALISRGFLSVNDRIVLTGVAGAGFWFNSGALTDINAGTQDVVVVGGLVSRTVGGTVGQCIKASGQGTKNVLIDGLQCVNGTVYAGPADVATSYPTDIHFKNMLVRDVNVSGAGSRAVSLYCDDCSMTGSRVSAATADHAVRVDFKVRQFVMGNQLQPGVVGKTFVGAASAATAVVNANDQ